MLWASLVAYMVKNLPAIWATQLLSLGWKDPLEKGMATHSNILAWKIPWTEKPVVHGVAESDVTEWVNIHTTESPSYTPKNNAALQINYTSGEKNEVEMSRRSGRIPEVWREIQKDNGYQLYIVWEYEKILLKSWSTRTLRIYKQVILHLILPKGQEAASDTYTTIIISLIPILVILVNGWQK